MKILVTRPRLFADSLCNSIKAIGATPILFPTIEIQPNPLSDALKQKILELTHYDCAIFNSRPAVIFGMKAIKSLLDVELLSNLDWIAQGPGTAAELYQAGIYNATSPSIPPYESESLIELPPLQKLQGKRIALFRGNEGRTLLLDTLIKGGAKVACMEMYRRCLPGKENDFPGKETELPGKETEPGKETDLHGNGTGLPRSETVVPGKEPKVSTKINQTNLPDAVIACSKDALKNLCLLMEDKVWQALRERPFIVVGERMFGLATDLGIKSIILSKGPSDLEFTQSVRTLKEALL